MWSGGLCQAAVEVNRMRLEALDAGLDFLEVFCKGLEVCGCNWVGFATVSPCSGCMAVIESHPSLGGAGNAGTPAGPATTSSKAYFLAHSSTSGH